MESSVDVAEEAERVSSPTPPVEFAVAVAPDKVTMNVTLAVIGDNTSDAADDIPVDIVSSMALVLAEGVAAPAPPVKLEVHVAPDTVSSIPFVL